MAKGMPANDVGEAAAQKLRDATRSSGAPSAPQPAVDVMKVLDRIAAALAALEGARTPPRVQPITKPEQAPRERPRLRHNWG